MRRVASAATFLLYGHVLEAERPHLLGVALCANFHAAIRGAQLTLMEAAVWVVAITALDQADIDAMAIGACEFCFLLRVAAIAQERLLLDEQHLLVRVVRRMATQAAHSLREVNGLAETAVLKARLVTAHAPLTGLVGRECGEGDDLAFVAAAVYVRASSSVAILASVLAVL